MAQRHKRVDVQVDHVQVGGEVPFNEFAVSAEARVVDKHVDVCAVQRRVKRFGMVGG